MSRHRPNSPSRRDRGRTKSLRPPARVMESAPAERQRPRRFHPYRACANQPAPSGPQQRPGDSLTAADQDAPSMRQPPLLAPALGLQRVYRRFGPFCLRCRRPLSSAAFALAKRTPPSPDISSAQLEDAFPGRGQLVPGAVGGRFPGAGTACPRRFLPRWTALMAVSWSATRRVCFLVPHSPPSAIRPVLRLATPKPSGGGSLGEGGTPHSKSPPMNSQKSNLIQPNPT